MNIFLQLVMTNWENTHSGLKERLGYHVVLTTHNSRTSQRMIH